jgi:hypothetical protein
VTTWALTADTKQKGSAVVVVTTDATTRAIAVALKEIFKYIETSDGQA